MPPKGIGGEQTVIPHMPPRGMPRILRMIEHGNPCDAPANRPVIIAPIRALAPRIVVALTGAIHDVAVLARVLELHRFGDADGHRAFLRIAKGHFPIGSMKRDLEIK